MARILILEPDPDVRTLLSRFVAVLGHEAVDADAASIDVVVAEPAAPDFAATFEPLLDERPALRVVCVSIYPQRACGAAFPAAAYLTKPVTVAQLASALESALAAGRAD